METLDAFSLLQTVPICIAQVVEAHTVVLQPDGLPPLLFLVKPPTSLLQGDNIRVHKLLILKTGKLPLFLTATELIRTAAQSTVNLLTLING